MNARQFNERNRQTKPIILTKDAAKAALEKNDGTCLTIITLTAWGDGKGGVFVNCYPDCGCSQDSFSTFDAFWDSWGDYFSTEGKIE